MNNNIVLKIIVGLIIVIIVAGAGIIIVESLRNSGQADLINGSTNRFGDVKKAIIKINTHNPELTDVFLVSASGAEKLFGSFTDIYAYSNVEYHNGTVYVIKRINYSEITDTDWQDELWAINLKLQESKLYTGRGFDFRVSPDERYVAIKENVTDGVDGISILQPSNNDIKAFGMSQVSLDQTSVSIELLGWADDNKTFWGGATQGHDQDNFFKIVLNGWEIQKVSSPIGLLNPDTALNLNTGILAYSNYPHFFDTESMEEFTSQKTPVKLFVKNLLTGDQEEISSSIAKQFDPVWVSSTELQYNNPANDGRQSFNLRDDFIQ